MTETTVQIRISRPIRLMLARRLSMTHGPSEIISRAAARYDRVCSESLPQDLTDAHWALIYDALLTAGETDSDDLEPARTMLRDYVNLYAALPPPTPAAMQLSELMERWTYAEWVAVVDRAERHRRLSPETDDSETRA